MSRRFGSKNRYGMTVTIPDPMGRPIRKYLGYYIFKQENSWWQITKGAILPVGLSNNYGEHIAFVLGTLKDVKDYMDFNLVSVTQ